jgi:hypothetical protein
MYLHNLQYILGYMHSIVNFTSVCFETDLFVSVVSLDPKHRKEPKKIIYWFRETSRNWTEIQNKKKFDTKSKLEKQTDTLRKG